SSWHRAGSSLSDDRHPRSKVRVVCASRNPQRKTAHTCDSHALGGVSFEAVSGQAGLFRFRTLGCHPEGNVVILRCASADRAYMRELLLPAAERAAAYLEGLEHRAVAPDPAAVAGLSAFGGPLPDEPADPEAILRDLDQIGSRATMAMAGPRFYG